jgi:MFS transporter, YNFM family, putative membrane transport protein
MSTAAVFPAARVHSAPPAPAPYIAIGTPAYRQVSLALFLAGFATFSLLYCVQPLLRDFARDFHCGAAASSLSLSLATSALALAIMAAGALSQMLPRRALMATSMILAALCNLAVAGATNWPLLLALRAAEGLALGGVPAVAMAYLAEEVDPADLGKAMGLYVAGTALGGMIGRIGMGLMLGLGSWRMAMAAMGAIDLAAALGFAVLLPASRHFTVQRGVVLADHLRIWRGQVAQGMLLRLFLIGFALMGTFVALFNYTGFRLAAAPYHLSESVIGLIFLSYLSGIVTSPMAGHAADRFGRRGPLAVALGVLLAGIALTLAPGLVPITLGILLITIGFFSAHAIASGWVGRLAGRAKGHGSSLYMLFYYLGSSVMGTMGGTMWQHWGWPGVAAMTGALALAGLVLALSLVDRDA